jgi:hypothetical protein
MRAFVNRCLQAAVLVCITTIFTGCESTDQGGSSTNVYYGSAFADPWYYGDYDYDYDVVVPPPGLDDRPVRPAHPIATPPPAVARPMPSIPSMPRVSARGR